MVILYSNYETFSQKKNESQKRNQGKCDVWCEKFEKRLIPKNPNRIKLISGNDDLKGNFLKFSHNFWMKIDCFQTKNNVEKVWMDSRGWQFTKETIPKKLNFLRPKKFSKKFLKFQFVKDFLKDNDFGYIRGEDKIQIGG